MVKIYSTKLIFLLVGMEFTPLTNKKNGPENIPTQSKK